MSRLPAEAQASWSSPPSEYRRERPPVPERSRSGGISTGWLIAGLAAAGLAAWAWYTLGPDLRRYLKIRSM
jgi:hypothetical protein